MGGESRVTHSTDPLPSKVAETTANRQQTICNPAGLLGNRLCDMTMSRICGLKGHESIAQALACGSRFSFGSALKGRRRTVSHATLRIPLPRLG